MASGANAYLQMPTSAINKILANTPTKMFNAGLDNNGFNSLSKLNQLSKADALANALATNNAAQAAESQVPSLARKAGRIVGNGINAAKGAAKGLGAAGLILAEAPTFSRYSATTPGMQQTMAENEAYLDAGYFRTDDGELIPLSNPTATPLPAEAGPAVLNAREKELFNGRTAPDKTLDITPSIYMDSDGNYKIGLTPQTQERIALKKQEDTPQVTTTTQTKTVATPSTDIDALVKATIRGDYGNGADRKKALGANYDAVQKAINGMNLPKASGSKTSKVKESSVAENLNKNSGNWMDTLNSLLPYLALGAGAYYLGRRN